MMTASLDLKDPSLLQIHSFIDGAFTPAITGKTFAVTNPSTGQILAQGADCNADDITRAIDAANGIIYALKIPMTSQLF